MNSCHEWFLPVLAHSQAESLLPRTASTPLTLHRNRQTSLEIVETVPLPNSHRFTLLSRTAFNFHHHSFKQNLSFVTSSRAILLPNVGWTLVYKVELWAAVYLFAISHRSFPMHTRFSSLYRWRGTWYELEWQKTSRAMFGFLERVFIGNWMPFSPPIKLPATLLCSAKLHYSVSSTRPLIFLRLLPPVPPIHRHGGIRSQWALPVRLRRMVFCALLCRSFKGIQNLHPWRLPAPHAQKRCGAII